MLSIIWLLCFLVITASDDFMPNLETTRFQQKDKEKGLPSFPFIHSLVDPCDSSANMFYSEDAPWGDFIGNGRIRLTQHPFGFIPSNLVDEHLIKLLVLKDAMREEEQFSLTQEFQLVVSQALHLINRIYSPMALRKCNGYKLESLPRDNLSMVFSTEEIYRSLIIVLLHLYAIMQDIYDSARLCPAESLAHLQILRQLIGKVETSMCLVLQSAAIGKRKEEVDYLKITQEILQTAIHRYYYCSVREVRECLVMNYTSAVFGFVQRHIDHNFDS